MQRLPARPFVSFCLATFNRGGVMLDCLQQTHAAAAAALGDKRFDIHIVDNASTDGTPELVQAWAVDHPQVKLHRLATNCGPVAKNIALHKNPADILVLLDDDAYPRQGALAQMVRHFQDDPLLGAAVFDVTLPDGRKEASAYPDVFIGAGTGLRGAALRAVAAEPASAGRPGRGLLPADFFMQAEEYDLSFRLLEGGWSVQRFWDMPLLHLKTPGARIGQRTTRLDVRNNMWLLARYIPDPLSGELAADWLARYWRMAVEREGSASAGGEGRPTHKAAFLRGASEGLVHWGEQRGTGLLSPGTLERIFKFDAIRHRLARAKEKYGLQRVVLGDWGKNLLAYYQAARALDLEVLAVVDGYLAADGGDRQAEACTPNLVDYRGIPVITEAEFRRNLEGCTDAIVLTQMSRVHAQRRAAAFRRSLNTPIIDLFDPLPSAVRPAPQPA